MDGRIEGARIGCRAALVWALAAGAAGADGHGLAMYGEPALPADYAHLPYANPDAPTGGRIVTGETGTFDSLNPFILKGTPPWQLRFLAVESLMGRSWDEPFTLYGLLAESVELADDRSWIEFTLNPEARFSDGSPVTTDDVLWSFETLGTIGNPRYLGLTEQIAGITVPREGVVRMEFQPNEDGEVDRELPLIAAMRPILKAAQWDDADFTESGLTPVITSAPYVVGDFEQGRFVSLRRDPDYWGADLPFMAGQANIDEIRMEYYGDAVAAFEAFKAGQVTTHREFNAGKWETQFDFPAVARGDVVLEEIAHQRPSGITGLVMNTRRAPFDDWRVRDALIHVFNFEQMNEALNGGEIPRIGSYFSNSPLGMSDGPAEGRVRELLEPFEAELLPGALEGYALPVAADARNRANIRAALVLLEQAGWTVQDGTLRDEGGAPFEMEILLEQRETEFQQIVDIWSEALARVGISPTVSVVEPAQYTERADAYDFDVTNYRRGLSLSPGNEQYLYWGSEGVEAPGTPNFAGIDSPAAEAMIDALLTAEDRDGFLAAARALDRVLTTGRYVIPIWEWNVSRIAYYDELHHPETIPLYGDWIGWQPDVWWYEAE
jgi:peptide/nickel transport system substrate-binding protein